MFEGKAGSEQVKQINISWGGAVPAEQSREVTREARERGASLDGMVGGGFPEEGTFVHKLK